MSENLLDKTPEMREHFFGNFVPNFGSWVGVLRNLLLNPKHEFQSQSNGLPWPTFSKLAVTLALSEKSGEDVSISPFKFKHISNKVRSTTYWSTQTTLVHLFSRMMPGRIVIFIAGRNFIQTFLEVEAQCWS